MYADIFRDASDNAKETETHGYMNLFNESPKASESSLQKYDLFATPSSKDIFANVAVDASRFKTSARSEVDVKSINVASTFDCNYIDIATIEKSFKSLAAENEKCTNILIDLSQEIQREYTRIEKMYATLVSTVEKIKESLVVKKTWLGKEIPIDVSQVNMLIDQAQDLSKEPFKIDLFLTSKIQDAFDKSQRCDVEANRLQQSFEHSINHGGAQADDPLYKRIVTMRKMVELQNLSTDKTLKMLQQSYNRIEEFRQNSLIIVLIDAQAKLIK